ncbi:MAG: contractile injection system tape measure protein, partial [Chitinophagales bacterium]
EKTLPVDLQLSDFEKQEVDDVLHSIIKHWTVLKNTSLDSLRNTFLQREGKLTFLDDEWLLQVEQKTVDILMNKMPWGVSYIKLPWMKHVLRTEWN